jgi:hypothetical protein
MAQLIERPYTPRTNTTPLEEYDMDDDPAQMESLQSFLSGLCLFVFARTLHDCSLSIHNKTTFTSCLLSDVKLEDSGIAGSESQSTHEDN